jgi:two-component system LytT family response regulator
MINVILVDDEENALKSLALKINRFYSNFNIVNTFQNPKEAVAFINNNKPDILFLDVEMPVLSGFDVLAGIENPDFEIIFVTAYNNYAIEAFQHCAIGYVLKPISNDELNKTINNAVKSIDERKNLNKNNALLERLIEKSAIANKLIVPTNKGLSFIPFNEVLHIEGYDGYTKIHLINNVDIVSSYNIGKFEKMIDDNFFKCHKSHIINLQKITAFEKEGFLILENKKRVPISKNKRKEFIDLCSK